MTRTMPLWGALLSLVLGWGSASYAQQATPVSAANDSLTTTGEEKPAPATPGAGPTAMDDTTTVKTVRRGADRMMYYVSLGIGSAYNYLPDSFHDTYDPAFGLRLGGGIARYNLRLGVTFSYNFFFSNGPTTLYPDDLNILTAFADLKFVPVGHTVRPYVLVCGGYFRTWVVNEDFVEGVMGYGGGAGIELEIDKVRHLFLEGRYVQGQTRVKTEQSANTEIVPITLGVNWIF